MRLPQGEGVALGVDDPDDALSPRTRIVLVGLLPSLQLATASKSASSRRLSDTSSMLCLSKLRESSNVEDRGSPPSSTSGRNSSSSKERESSLRSGSFGGISIFTIWSSLGVSVYNKNTELFFKQLLQDLYRPLSSDDSHHV